MQSLGPHDSHAELGRRDKHALWGKLYNFWQKVEVIAVVYV